MSNNLETVIVELLLLCLCLVFAFVFGAHPDASQDQSNTVPDIITPTADTQGKNICFWDWKGAIVSQVDSYSAPSGYNYAVVTVYIKNEADNSVSTNPLNWSLIADGIKYTPDASISSNSIKHQTVDVGKGGEIETQFVYLIKGDPSEAILRYKGVSPPEMQRENHYTTQT
jgi:archaellum component FlaG (FlaF/FlaG flagellin family)